MSDENNNMPLHEQAYRIVVDAQEAKKRRDNAWQSGTDNFATRTPLAVWGGLFGGVIAAFVETDGVIELFLVPLIGVLIGAGCGWLFGQTLRVIFVKIPMLIIGAFRGNREPPV